MLSKLLHQVNVLDSNRFRRCNHLTPATAFGVFPIDGARLCSIFLSFFLGVIRANGLGRVLEHGVVLVNHDLGHKSDDIAFQAFLGKGLAQTHLNHETNQTLGLSDTEVDRHARHSKLMVTSLMLQHHIAHLRAITVTYHQVVIFFQEGKQGMARLRDVFHLFPVGSLLSASQQCVSAESDDS